MKTREIAFVSFILVAICFLIRFPFFFRVVMDWDESTYILMAQSFLNGHLPYTELWDNKPPFIFYMVGFFIFLFGKSIAAVRIGGTLSVALSSLFVYLTGRKIWESKTISLVAALLFIFTSSNTLSGYATISEHLALVLLLPAVYLFFTTLAPFRKFFLIGFLLTAASLVRMNLAFVSMGVGLFIFAYYIYVRDLSGWFKNLAAYSAGMLVCILISLLPYLLSGQAYTWWNSVVVAPLAYSTSQYTVPEILGIQVRYVFTHITSYPNANSLTALLILTGSTGMILGLLKWKNRGIKTRTGLIFLLVILLFTEFSILFGGAFWPHYMIQLIPVLCLSSAGILLYIKKRSWKMAVLAAYALLMFFTLKAPFYEYELIMRNYHRTGQLKHGPAYEIVSYVKENHIPKDKVLLFTEHISYWLMDTKPFDKVVTHPSNIHLDYMLTHIRDTTTSPLIEMSNLLQRAPELIVLPDKYIHYVDPAADSLLMKEIASKYFLDKIVYDTKSKSLLYRRKNN